jgi:hypothetical protein
MRTLFISFFISVMSLQAWSQDGLCSGHPPTCNSGSDGYIEFDIYSVFFYGSGYVGYPPTVIVSSYLWFNGATSANVYNLSAGVYDLTISLNFQPVYYHLKSAR